MYIYIYYKNKMPLYVGQTNNILTRDSQHRRNEKWYYECNIIKFAEVKSQKDLDKFESYLISKYGKYNIQHPSINEINKDSILYEINYLKWYEIPIDKISCISNYMEYAIVCQKKYLDEHDERYGLLYKMAVENI